MTVAIRYSASIRGGNVSLSVIAGQTKPISVTNIPCKIALQIDSKLTTFRDTASVGFVTGGIIQCVINTAPLVGK